MTTISAFLAIDASAVPIAPRYGKVFLSHMTLAYAVPPNPTLLALNGRDVTLRATAICHNDEIEAICVAIDDPEVAAAFDAFKETNAGNASERVPHITLSGRPGIAPIKAAAMLASGHETVSVNFTIPGRLECLAHGKRATVCGVELRSVDDFVAARSLAEAANLPPLSPTDPRIAVVAEELDAAAGRWAVWIEGSGPKPNHDAEARALLARLDEPDDEDRLRHVKISLGIVGDAQIGWLEGGTKKPNFLKGAKLLMRNLARVANAEAGRDAGPKATS